jgi:hypothetical protein
MDKQCVNCGHTFNIHHLNNGLCYTCEPDEYDDYDLSEESCKLCGSQAVGMSNGKIECFECSHEWEPKN